MKKNVFVALDNMDKEEIFRFLSLPENDLTHIKIGLEMFCKYGPDFIVEVHERFKKTIFLDLKLHDIPNTVKKSIASLKGLPLSFLTVHLSGGEKMLKEAVSMAAHTLPNCQLLGVSYLTSLALEDFETLWGFKKDDLSLAFTRLFKLAIHCQVPGLVCSPNELSLVQKIKEKTKSDILTVCPGIRFSDQIKGNQTDDQKRVMDPKKAIELNADYLVMGRSLTQSENLKKRIDYLKEIHLL